MQRRDVETGSAAHDDVHRRDFDQLCGCRGNGSVPGRGLPGCGGRRVVERRLPDLQHLAGVPHRPGTLGVPVLDECYADFECRVANVMDTGSSTCFLGDVVAVGHGAATTPRGAVMTAAHFRANMPSEWRADYEALLRAAQQFAADRSRDIRPVTWKDIGGR